MKCWLVLRGWKWRRERDPSLVKNTDVENICKFGHQQHSMLHCLLSLKLSSSVGLPDNSVKEKNEEGRWGEGERARAGQPAGPWVPVDKAIMDYHNWRTLEWVISGKAYKTRTEGPARDWFFLASHPVILQSCWFAELQIGNGIVVSGMRWLHLCNRGGQMPERGVQIVAFQNHLQSASNAIDYDTPR